MGRNGAPIGRVEEMPEAECQPASASAHRRALRGEDGTCQRSRPSLVTHHSVAVHFQHRRFEDEYFETSAMRPALMSTRQQGQKRSKYQRDVRSVSLAPHCRLT
jgi:hypothetical protein